MKITFLLPFLFSVLILQAQKDIYDISRHGTLEELKTIYELNPDIINTKNDDGNTPLILACYYGNTEVASFLIEHVIDINIKTGQGTAIMAAIVNGNKDLVSQMLLKKPDLNLADINGTTALHYAILFKNKDIIRLLIEAGAKHNIKDNYGKSVMDYAIINNDPEIINLLKSHTQ